MLKEQIIQFTRDNVALFDCAGDCPDEVAIYENEHYGETIRTPEYCNQCFAKRLVKLFKAEVDKLTVIDGKRAKEAWAKPIHGITAGHKLFLMMEDNVAVKSVASEQLQHTKKQLLDLMGS